MQISDQNILQMSTAQIIGPVNESARPKNRSTVKPVVIEGQLSSNNKTDKQSQSQYYPAEQEDNDSSPSTLVPLNQQTDAEQYSNTSLLTNNPLSINSTSKNLSSSNTDTMDNEVVTNKTNEFPYSNRRSVAGLAGQNLITQHYLNNEPVSSSNRNFQAKIDFFI